MATYLSHSAAVILQALANGYQYGFDIMDISGLPSGTVYPALRRLEQTGLIDSKWEKAGIAQREQRRTVGAGIEAPPKPCRRQRGFDMLNLQPRAVEVGGGTELAREQRPPRKYYELTPDGKEALAEALKRYRLLESLLPHPSRIKPSRQRG